MGYSSRSKGFTLIEMMIVIAIIGILAAIAVPNFITYRDKAFCSATESDAEYIRAGISDYFAINSRTSYPVNINVNVVDLGTKTFKLSYSNTATISGGVDLIIITVTDGSGRCPLEYRQNNSKVWVGGGNFVQKTL